MTTSSLIKHIITFVAGVVVLTPAMAFSATIPETPPAAAVEFSQADAPRYVFTLSLSEFSMFNNSLVSGLARRGGAAEVDLRVVNMPQASRPWWVVSTANADAVNVYRQWVSAELLNVVEHTDFDSIDPLTTRSLDSIGSLGRRLAYALENPVRAVHRLTGTLQTTGSAPVVIRGDGSTVRLTGETSQLSSAYNGLRVRASGSIIEPGQMAVSQLAPVTTNSLEIFTMPFCPSGQQTLASIADYLKEQSATGKLVPDIKVRYIFYRISEDSQSEYYCLHGQREMDESVVQILIRDMYPDSFMNYLRIRFRNPEAAWQQLAAQAGLDQAVISSLTGLIQTDVRDIISQEYEYVHDLCGVDDRSPTYFWNSQQIDDLRAAEPFADINEAILPDGTCAQ